MGARLRDGRQSRPWRSLAQTLRATNQATFLPWMPLLTLPLELLTHVFEYMDLTSLLRCSEVRNSQFNRGNIIEKV